MKRELDADIRQLTSVCRDLFGDESLWIEPEGYRRSVALCIIDSIFSTGSHYQSVINVVAKYCAYRKSQGADPFEDGATELMRTFDELGGSVEWAAMVGNFKPAHTRAGAPLKAEIVHQAASRLAGFGVATAILLATELSDENRLAELKKAWSDLPSQSSGVTFNYFLILAGYQSVKPDRMILGFIEQHTNLKRQALGTVNATELIRSVAMAYPTEPRKLDHVIWRHMSNREFVASNS